MKDMEKELATNTHSDKSQLIIRGNKDNKVILISSYNKKRLLKCKMYNGEYRASYIGKVINKQEDCHFMYRTTETIEELDDTFNEELIGYIKDSSIEFLIDIHIVHSARRHDIELGTNFGKNIDIGYAKDISRLLKSKYCNVVIDCVFPANKDTSLSNVISKECKIHCLQLGINWDLMKNEYEVKELIYSLSNTVKLLNEDWESN